MVRRSIALVVGSLAAWLILSGGAAGALEISATTDIAEFSPDADGQADIVHLSYSVTDAAQVTVNILDAEGRIVQTLYAAGDAATANLKGPGTVHQLTWDGRDYSGGDLPDGTYTYWINAEQAQDDGAGYELTQHGDGSTPIRTPRYLRVDGEGNLYMVDLWSAGTHGGMSKFAADGTPLWYFVAPAGDEPGHVRFVKDFAFDDQGHVYWSDTTDDLWSRVNVWNLGPDGLTYAGVTFGRGGNGPSSGTDIVMDALSFMEYYDGALYLGDAQNDRVQKVQPGATGASLVWVSYATEGTGSDYLRRGLRDVHAVRVAPNPAVDPSQPDAMYLFVADPGEQEHHTPPASPRASSVAILDLDDGTVLKRYPDPDSPVPGTQVLFSDQVIKGLGVDHSDGSFYVAEYKRGTGTTNDYQVLKVSAQGQLLLRIHGANGRDFTRPYSVALDTQTDPATGMKRLYVSDQNNNRVVRVVLQRAEETGQITLRRTRRMVLHQPGNEGGLTVSAAAAGGGRRGPAPKVEAGTPVRTRLLASYPNPFNASTTVRFAVATDAPVQLSLYDMAGRVVRTLAAGPHAAGFYAVTWDGMDDASAPVASGVYLVVLAGDGQRQTGKLLLLR